MQTASGALCTPAERTSRDPAVMEVHPEGNEPGNLKQVNVKYVKFKFEKKTYAFLNVYTANDFISICGS